MKTETQKFIYTQQQVEEAYKKHFSRVFNLKRDAITIFIVFTLAVYEYFQFGWDFFSISLMLVTILFTSILLASFLLLPKIYFSKHNSYKSEYEIEISEDNLKWKTNKAEAKLKWDYFIGYVETENLLLLYYRKKCFYILPKIAFNDEADLKDCILIIKSNLSIFK